MSGNVSPGYVLVELERAKLGGSEPALTARLIKARTVLLAMPEPAQLHYAGIMADMMNRIPTRGLGVVTALELLVAIGDKIERAT